MNKNEIRTRLENKLRGYLIEDYVTARKIIKNFELGFEDLLKYYNAKANIFAEKFENSERKNYKFLMKSVNAMIMYDKLEGPSPFQSLI